MKLLLLCSSLHSPANLVMFSLNVLFLFPCFHVFSVFIFTSKLRTKLCIHVKHCVKLFYYFGTVSVCSRGIPKIYFVSLIQYSVLSTLFSDM
jgi:hypothetical protein